MSFGSSDSCPELSPTRIVLTAPFPLQQADSTRLSLLPTSSRDQMKLQEVSSKAGALPTLPDAALKTRYTGFCPNRTS